jgi:hypothetical protein
MDGDGVALRVRDQELQQRGQKGPHGSSEEDGDWLGLQGNVTNEQEEGPRKCGLGKVVAGIMSKRGRDQRRRYQG